IAESQEIGLEELADQTADLGGGHLGGGVAHDVGQGAAAVEQRSEYLDAVPLKRLHPERRQQICRFARDDGAAQMPLETHQPARVRTACGDHAEGSRTGIGSRCGSGWSSCGSPPQNRMVPVSRWPRACSRSSMIRSGPQYGSRAGASSRQATSSPNSASTPQGSAAYRTTSSGSIQLRATSSAKRQSCSTGVLLTFDMTDLPSRIFVSRSC